MAVSDRMFRRGDRDNRVLQGPGAENRLIFRGKRHNNFYTDLTRFTGDVDVFEVSETATIGDGVDSANIFFNILPFIENGRRNDVRGIGAVAVILRADNTSPGELLYRRDYNKNRYKLNTRIPATGSFETDDNEIVYVVIKRTDVSTISYQLQMDTTNRVFRGTADIDTKSVATPVKAPPVPPKPPSDAPKPATRKKAAGKTAKAEALQQLEGLLNK